MFSNLLLLCVEACGIQGNYDLCLQEVCSLFERNSFITITRVEGAICSGRTSYVCAQSLSHVWFFATPWTIALQAPVSMRILQASILEWVAVPFSRGSSQSRDQTLVSHMAGRFLTIWATREAIYKTHDHGTTEEKLLFPEGSKNWILVYEGHRKEMIFDLSHDMFDESINYKKILKTF